MDNSLLEKEISPSHRYGEPIVVAKGRPVEVGEMSVGNQKAQTPSCSQSVLGLYHPAR